MAIFYDQAQRPLFRRRDRFEPAHVLKRLSQPVRVNLLFTLRYSLPIFRFLKLLKSEATMSLADNLRSRTILPEGPDVELHDVEPTGTTAKVEDIISRWVSDGFCCLDEILILSPHGTKAKTSSYSCRNSIWFRTNVSRCKVANYLRIWAAPRKLSANGSTLFANGEGRSVMICGWGTLFMQ
jgi:hypothetical protein